MKKIYIGLLISLISTASYAQDVNFEWAKSMGGTSGDFGRSITTDASGNVYVTGQYEGMVDFDPGPLTFNLTSNGNQDIFIQKLDAGGNFLWAHSLGETGSDRGYSITTDALGNVYVTGDYHGTVDFDPGPTPFNLSSNGEYDIFIQKLDAGGNFLWAKSIGGIGSDKGNSIAVDAAGNVYVSGLYSNSMDFDPGPITFNLTSNGSFDFFALKLDVGGNFLWAKSIGGSGADESYSITIGSLGNVYVTGYYHGTVDFDPGPLTFNLTSNGLADNFIQKLDAGGNFLWVKSIGGTNQDWGHSITTDASDNVYVTGIYSNTVDFDPGPLAFNLTSNGSYDIFVLKVDAGGNLLWAKSMGGPDTDWGHSITTDASDNVYVTGRYRVTADFDPGALTFNLTSNGSYDIFALKLDVSGNFLWAKSIGEAKADQGYSITTDASDNVHITGIYKVTADFDPGPLTFNLTSNGLDDIFVLKLSECIPTSSNDVITACDTFTWIDGIIYTADNDSATFILTNAAGCDSVVTLNLTIDPFHSPDCMGFTPVPTLSEWALIILSLLLLSGGAIALHHRKKGAIA